MLVRIKIDAVIVLWYIFIIFKDVVNDTKLLYHDE